MNYNSLLTIEKVADELQISKERARQLVLSEELPSKDYEHVRLCDVLDYMRNGGI